MPVIGQAALPWLLRPSEALSTDGMVFGWRFLDGGKRGEPQGGLLEEVVLESEGLRQKEPQGYKSHRVQGMAEMSC